MDIEHTRKITWTRLHTEGTATIKEDKLTKFEFFSSDIRRTIVNSTNLEDLKHLHSVLTELINHLK